MYDIIHFVDAIQRKSHYLFTRSATRHTFAQQQRMHEQQKNCKNYEPLRIEHIVSVYNDSYHLLFFY